MLPSKVPLLPLLLLPLNASVRAGVALDRLPDAQIAPVFEVFGPRQEFPTTGVGELVNLRIESRSSSSPLTSKEDKGDKEPGAGESLPRMRLLKCFERVCCCCCECESEGTATASEKESGGM